MGKKIVITEKLIANLLGYDGTRVKCRDLAERISDLNIVFQKSFVSGLESNKIKDLKDYLRI